MIPECRLFVSGKPYEGGAPAPAGTAPPVNKLTGVRPRRHGRLKVPRPGRPAAGLAGDKVPALKKFLTKSLNSVYIKAELYISCITLREAPCILRSNQMQSPDTARPICVAWAARAVSSLATSTKLIRFTGRSSAANAARGMSSKCMRLKNSNFSVWHQRPEASAAWLAR